MTEVNAIWYFSFGEIIHVISLFVHTAFVFYYYNIL